MRAADFWEKTDDGRVRCLLCPHACRLAEGQTGLCRVRTVRAGKLTAAAYGLISSAGVDPIEKKPLYHFHPGADIFSIGGWGCNFACAFCQNWTISQQVLDDSRQVQPKEIVTRAGAGDSIGIAYTYNEPLIAYEFVTDCARLARERGLANVLVTNGFIRPEPAARLLPLIDALNIDVKSMEDSFYRTHCRGRLEPVKAFAAQAKQAGRHVEITNLVIPGLNDEEHLFAELADWVVDALGAETPLHLSAYRPMYKMEAPPTDPGILRKAYRICAQRLNYVYLGNVAGNAGASTLCPGCGTVLVERYGYRTRIAGLNTDEGKCSVCGRAADFVS